MPWINKSVKLSGRRLYKQLIFAGREYPGGLAEIRNKTKAEYQKLEFSTDETEIKKAIANGRWWLKEIQSISRLHKYREMKKRYDRN